MATADDLLSLVPLIYDVAVDPELWPPFLDALNAKLDGATSAFHLQRVGDSQSGQVFAAVGMDQAYQQRYAEYYASTNIWTIRGQRQLEEGVVLTGEMVCPNKELEHSEYYNDFLRPQGFYYALASVPSADVDTRLIVATLRAKERGTFEPEFVKLQRHLTPHSKRAAQVHDRLLSAALERRALRDALERMPTGVVLLDDRGKVLFANRVARDIAAAQDGFELTREGPVAARPRRRRCSAADRFGHACDVRGRFDGRRACHAVAPLRTAPAGGARGAREPGRRPPR